MTTPSATTRAEQLQHEIRGMVTAAALAGNPVLADVIKRWDDEVGVLLTEIQRIERVGKMCGEMADKRTEQLMEAKAEIQQLRATTEAGGLQQLLDKQQALDPAAAKVLYDNLWDLYGESEHVPVPPVSGDQG